MASRIGIIIPEERQIDYYLNFLKNFNPNDLTIIVNDSDEEVGELIYKNLNLINYNREYLSSILGENKKFDFIISTGNFRVPINSSAWNRFLWLLNQYFKFLYSRSFGLILQLSGLSAFLEKILNRPFDAGGKNRKFPPVRAEFIEKKVGKKIILFPRGMDINSKTHPSPEFLRRFDIFLCHGLKDYELIKNKTDAPAFIIGYPRYEKNDEETSVKTNLLKEFNLDNNKKTILWMPSRLDWEHPNYRNIEDWLSSFSFLQDNFQLIIRPHPHLVANNPELITRLIENKCNVDSLKSRNLYSLYSASDLVIADYGGSIFSGIYMHKPVILLNSANHNFVSQSNELDFSLRYKFQEYHLTDSKKFELMLKNLDENQINNLNQDAKKIRLEIFSDDNTQEFLNFISK